MKTLKKIANRGVISVSIITVVLGLNVFAGLTALVDHLAGVNPNWGAALLLLAAYLVVAGAIVAASGVTEYPHNLVVALVSSGLALALAYLLELQAADWTLSTNLVFVFLGIVLSTMFVTSACCGLKPKPPDEPVDEAEPVESD